MVKEDKKRVKRKGRETNGAKLCTVDRQRSTFRMDVPLLSPKQVKQEQNQVPGASSVISVNKLFGT